MNFWRIEIQGEPVAKQRARVVRNRHTGRMMAYTPKKTASWERRAAIEAKRNLPRWPATRRPVKITIVARMPIPGSWPAWKREAAAQGQIEPTGKPDIDNIVKAVKDAMNGIVWDDDSQVVSIKAEKTYSTEPAVILEVSEASGMPARVARKADMQQA